MRRSRAKEKKSLVLDDVLGTIGDIRKLFKLPKPDFGLKQIERVAGASKALGEIIEATKVKHGPEICSKHHGLLKELGPKIYAGKIKGRAFSGYRRLSHSHVDRVLRRFLRSHCELFASCQPATQKSRGHRTN